ncbi:MAG: 30S ribosomal protein S1, partial [Bryobacteraceae bacterium]
MSNARSEIFVPGDETPQETSTFAEMLSDFEQQHRGNASERVIGTVISAGPETIVVDIGRKMEGSLALEKWRET